MRGSGLVRTFVVWRPWLATHEAIADEAAAARDARRQRHLAQLQRYGIPAWSAEPEYCDECGRLLLTGERPMLLQGREGLTLACPLCSERLQATGCRPLACGEGPEQLELAG